MENKTDLQCEIENAIKDAGIDSFEVNNRLDIMAKIEKIYVTGQPRAWWSSLNGIKAVHRFPNNLGYASIPSVVENLDKRRYIKNERVYFIADENNEFL